jgi:hypothetical protein
VRRGPIPPTPRLCQKCVANGASVLRAFRLFLVGCQAPNAPPWRLPHREHDRHRCSMPSRDRVGRDADRVRRRPRAEAVVDKRRLRIGPTQRQAFCRAHRFRAPSPLRRSGSGSCCVRERFRARSRRTSVPSTHAASHPATSPAASSPTPIRRAGRGSRAASLRSWSRPAASRARDFAHKSAIFSPDRPRETRRSCRQRASPRPSPV